MVKVLKNIKIDIFSNHFQDHIEKEKKITDANPPIMRAKSSDSVIWLMNVRTINGTSVFWSFFNQR
jgi:hypothetical protein